ncbi:MAG: histidine kinase dimerization/phosphoacceptor domain -containing protein [Bacteroidota bacterium]
MINNSVFTHVINNFLEHVYVLNERGEIVFQTENNSSLLGFSEKEIAENGFTWLFINPLFSLETVLETVVKFGEIYGTENFKHKTRTFINIAFRVQCIEDQEKKEPLFVFYLRDNTQQNLVRKDILKKSLTIENLSRSRRIRDGEIDKAIYEILESSSRAMNTTRVNAWIFDEDKTRIQCVGNFDARVNKLVPQTDLPRIAMPFYFKLFETEKIILTRDSFNETKTAELYDFYLKPNNIQSLMDIPVRIEGEMIGVICFENVGAPRVWTLQEQKYGLVAAQMLSLTIESHNKQQAKRALEIALNEQTVLLQEVNHRVKNNLAIVGSLLNMQSEKSSDDYHKQLFMECRNRIDSIAAVHELIYKAKSYAELNFKEYLNQLVDHISESYKSIEHVKIIKGITDVHINIAAAIPLGLIVNELITNAYKHAFSNKTEGQIEVILLENNNQVFLTIKDNGEGFDKNVIPKNSIGMDILAGLIEQINGNYTLNSDKKGTIFKISFSKK